MARIGIEIALTGAPPRTLTFEREEVIIGRSPQAHVVLENDQVSRQHCRLSFKDGRWRVTDNNSANGVYLDRGGRGAPFLSRNDVVVHGDHLYLGRYRLTVLLEGLEAPAALAEDAALLEEPKERTRLMRRGELREDVRTTMDQIRRNTPTVVPVVKNPG